MDLDDLHVRSGHAESYLTGALFPQILQRTERLGCHADVIGCEPVQMAR